MKHLMTLLMVVLIALAVAVGCGAATPADSSKMEVLLSVGAGSSETQRLPIAKITYSVDTVLIEKEVLAEDGTKLAESSHELPQLHAYREDGTEIVTANTTGEERALKVTAAFNEGFAVWRSGDGTMEEMAQEEYALRPDMFRDNGMYYEDQLGVRVYTTEHLVSVEGSSYSYYGGAHPNTVLLAWNFDLDQGMFFNPATIAEDGPAFIAGVTEELVVQAEEDAAESGSEIDGMYWPDYETILADWSNYAVSFDAAGMTVSFSPYELGCYAAGSHRFTLSYAVLEPYLSEYGRTLLALPPAEGG